MAAKTASRLDSRFAAEVARVQPSLAAWRKRRKHREPIPEKIWRPMAALARRYGLSAVARALRVNYTALQRHTLGRPIREPSTPGSLSAGFVEVPMGRWFPVSSGQWMVELEDGRGFKLTLRLAPDDKAAMLALAQGLWRQRA
jgi:hypothetical protein